MFAWLFVYLFEIMILVYLPFFLSHVVVDEQFVSGYSSKMQKKKKYGQSAELKCDNGITMIYFNTRQVEVIHDYWNKEKEISVLFLSLQHGFMFNLIVITLIYDIDTASVVHMWTFIRTSKWMIESLLDFSVRWCDDWMNLLVFKYLHWSRHCKW